MLISFFQLMLTISFLIVLAVLSRLNQELRIMQNRVTLLSDLVRRMREQELGQMSSEIESRILEGLQNEFEVIEEPSQASTAFGSKRGGRKKRDIVKGSQLLRDSGEEELEPVDVREGGKVKVAIRCDYSYLPREGEESQTSLDKA